MTLEYHESAARSTPATLHCIASVCEQLRVAVEDASVISDRAHSTVVSVDGLVIKLYPPSERRLYEVELSALRSLRRMRSAVPTLVRVPELVSFGTACGRLFVALSRLPGQRLSDVWNTMSAPELADVLRQLGASLRSVHDTSRHTALSLPRWPGAVEERCAEAVARHRAAGLDARTTEQLASYLTNASTELATLHSQALLQSELKPWHVLVERRRGRWTIEGVVDFNSAMTGPRELDFVCAGLFAARGRPDLQAAFFEGYGCHRIGRPGDLDRTLMVCTILHPYGDVVWLAANMPKAPDRLDAHAMQVAWWSEARLWRLPTPGSASASTAPTRAGESELAREDRPAPSPFRRRSDVGP